VFEQTNTDFLHFFAQFRVTIAILSGFVSSGATISFSESPKYYIGYEIEKEDTDVKLSININDFENKCYGWKKEKDGSLDCEKGYELISPKLELNVAFDEIMDYINNNSKKVFAV